MHASERANILSLRPYLDPQDFDRAFPFHIHVDESLRVLGVGTSLAKMLKRPVRGLPLTDIVTCRRPNDAANAQAWREHASLVVLITCTTPTLSLRGSVSQMEDGTLLFVVAPLAARIEEVTELGLGLTDFALHDPLGEVLLINRAAQMTLADAHRLADRLRWKTAQLNTIMELSSNGVVYISPLQQVDYVNSALAAMIGCERADILGRDIQDLDRRIEACMASGEMQRAVLTNLLSTHPLPSESVTLELAQPDKHVLQVSVRASAEGGCVAYFRDITAESEVDRMKSEFLSTAAHELRTPMASVFGFSELLLRRDFPPERQREMLDTIHRQAGVLINLINELLDLARIEARRGKDFRRQVLPIGPIVNQALSGLLILGDSRAVQLSMDCGDAKLWIDAEKLGHALTNVLSNAYKYSPAGGAIAMRVYLAADLPPDPSSLDAGDPGSLVVEVEDHGLGMTREQLMRVFERFYRADPSGSIPGTGLGMCLVKEIIELHGGTVAIASEYGHGTTVSLRLPLACAQASEAASQELTIGEA